MKDKINIYLTNLDVDFFLREKLRRTKNDFYFFDLVTSQMKTKSSRFNDIFLALGDEKAIITYGGVSEVVFDSMGKVGDNNYFYNQKFTPLKDMVLHLNSNWGIDDIVACSLSSPNKMISDLKEYYLLKIYDININLDDLIK